MAAPTSCPHCKSKRLGVGRWTSDNKPVFKCMDCKREITPGIDDLPEFFRDILKQATK